MREIDLYFDQKEEPVKSCLAALRHLLLNHHSSIAEVWRYKMPFYCIRKSDGNEKRFCYLWVDKKTRFPYLGIVEGQEFENLTAEKRSRMKILIVDPQQDLPVEEIQFILDKAIAIAEQQLDRESPN